MRMAGTESNGQDDNAAEAGPNDVGKSTGVTATGSMVLLDSEREREDEGPDSQYVVSTALDNGAQKRLTALYRELLPEGATILDLGYIFGGGCGVSLLPEDCKYSRVEAIGLEAGLKSNPRLDSWDLQDLNDLPGV
jgi:hypothetical protein